MEEAIQSRIGQLMASINSDDLLHDLRPVLVVHKDGRVQRFFGTEPPIPAGVDQLTAVESKDVVVSPESGVFVRLYKPPGLNPNQKVPLLVYFHGGAFCIESAASPQYHTYLNSLCSKANILVASVEYRLAPEFPLPTAYDDSWLAIQFVASAATCDGDPWLRDHADYSRVFFAGDSAGGNISHHMAKRIKKEPLPNFDLNGIVLVHPYFWGSERIGSEHLKEAVGMIDRLWKFACPESSGSDDPLMNPAEDPEAAELGCGIVLVAVAEKDALRDRGLLYKETLEKRGWRGAVEVVETAEEDHIFYLMKPSSATAGRLMGQVVEFLNRH